MSRARGQALTEFALAAPILLTLLLGLFDLGRVVWAQGAVANAAREAARYAIVRGGSATTACPVGPPATTAVIPPASTSCPYPSPSKQGIVNVGSDFAWTAGGTNTITVCYGAGCSGNSDSPGATNARGTLVTVRVDSTVPLLTNALLGWSPMTVSSSTTMVISH